MTDTAAVSLPPSAIPDLSGKEFWTMTARQRDESFAALRQWDELTFQRPPEMSLTPAQHGYWAAVRHADVRYVSRHPELFCSGEGVTLDEAPAELNELAAAFLPTDAPKHTRLRRLVTHAFTARRVRTIQEQIERQAKAIVETAVAADSVEVVRDVSMRLPLWTISEMIGVPEDRREEMYDAANVLVGTADAEFVADTENAMLALLGGIGRLHDLAHDMVDRRRVEPRDDLMTALVQAEVEGETLTADEIASFLCLLAVAGNDTTRNTITHSIKAFSDFPDQWALLRSDVDSHLGTAVEEMVRWATPVHLFRRTAVTDTEIRGQRIRAGDRVVMFYASANRDESVFDDPWRFDITRTPNDHLGFGGGGPHFCLGAHIARAQVRAVFRELARNVAGFEAGKPDFIVGNLIHNVRSLQCTFTRA
ncbi:MAG: cytochrome [Streptosporangiaceae bacterium]|nr:cytochrome [Streptosporangiaceae bacterium]